MVSAEKVLGTTGTEDGAGDVEVAQTISQKRLSKPLEVFDEVVDSVDVPMPQVVEEVLEVAQISPERDQEAHRLESAIRPRSRNASRRREWISWCLR